MVKIKNIDKDIVIINLFNDEINSQITNFGANIISLKTKDKNGKFTDNVLGFDDMETYKSQDKYIGAVIGRCANRIEKACFTLDGEKYNLAQNNSVNHLHGGINGFDKKIFNYEIADNAVKLTYFSPDMEEGYCGNLKFSVTYKIEKNNFIICYEAETDKATVFNPTNHTYFNFNENKKTITNHFLQIKANSYGEIDENGLATGKLLSVANTAFDFIEMKKIGDDINSKEKAIVLGNGYDHSFIFNDTNEQIKLYEKDSGKLLTVTTDMPVFQLYTANFLDGTLKGKNNIFYNKRDGVCLETGFFPNAINNQFRDTVILKPNKKFKSETVWNFSLVGEEINDENQ